MVILAFSMLSFGAINTYIGFSLLGDRGIENRRKIQEAFDKLREINAAQRTAVEQRESKARKAQ